jgi:hypothetical protein
VGNGVGSIGLVIRGFFHDEHRGRGGNRCRDSKGGGRMAVLEVEAEGQISSVNSGHIIRVEQVKQSPVSKLYEEAI